MGRQISIVMAAEDEQAFLDFLRSTTEVQLIEQFKPNEADVFVSEIADDVMADHWTYLIWNKAFPWRPTIAHVGLQAVDASHIGWAYVANTAGAPVLEFSRSPGNCSGRLYWARYFTSVRGDEYDFEAFDRWIDQAWRWCRKQGKRIRAGDPSASYVLPAARARLND
jgi:hypothetical protein